MSHQCAFSVTNIVGNQMLVPANLNMCECIITTQSGNAAIIFQRSCHLQNEAGTLRVQPQRSKL